MDRDLSRSLHALTIRLDRMADRILRVEQGVSYRRFLTLYAVREMGGTTQRDLAEWMGITEASVSRMTRVLAQAGLLDARAEPSGGNRRRLELTDVGQRLVARCGALLEDTFAELVEAAGVSYDDYRTATGRLLDEVVRPTEEPTSRSAETKPDPPTTHRRRSRRAS